MKGLEERIRLCADSFDVRGNTFTGAGWDKILADVKKSPWILIGEDHMTNEIPEFVSKIVEKNRFDAFFCEIDPLTSSLLEKHCLNSKSELRKRHAETLSFYSLEPEYRLVQQLVRSKARICGTDQILIISDALVCSHLRQRTRNRAAREIYTRIEERSKKAFEALKSSKGGPYLVTPDCQKDLAALSALSLSSEEARQIAALQMSARIYQTQNHALRVQWMKHQLLEEKALLATGKKLFKYGAVHLPRGESLLKVYDLGNFVHNLADSRFENTLHIMIVGRKGTRGVPFRGLKPQRFDETDENLKSLAPFFTAYPAIPQHWQTFDLRRLRVGEPLTFDNATLRRIIEGYDFLVVIPEVTPAPLLKLE